MLTFTFKIWVSIYGAPEKFLTDNGGEFANTEFIKMTNNLGITVKVTAAESPWSNKLIERYNVVLADMLNKVSDDSQYLPDLTVPW